MEARVQGGPGTDDPGRAEFRNVTMDDLLTRAYGVRHEQIIGPSWFGTQRFDIVAKIPSGASREQFLAMLRNLLAERFGLVLHVEQRELPSYALTVDKAGSKLKASDRDPNPDGDRAAPAGDRMPFPPGRPPEIKVDRDGFPDISEVTVNAGTPIVISGTALGARLTARHASIAQLAKVLAFQLDLPVADMTGLNGFYDFSFTFSGTNSALMQRLAGRGLPATNSPGDGNGPDLFQEIKSQLGLKLELKKSSTNVLVIDHVERVPKEN
jgi:uncharacterized protein (TIGR03435 family)